MSDAIDKLQDLWFAWDQGSMIGMADTINAIRPALDEMAEARAEIARLTAELAASHALLEIIDAAVGEAIDAAFEAGSRMTLGYDYLPEGAPGETASRLRAAVSLAIREIIGQPIDREDHDD